MNELIAIGAVIFLISAVAGYFIARAKAFKSLAAVFGVLIATTGALFIAADQATGWDGLIYITALIGGVAPAAGGTAIGAITGAMQNSMRAPVAE